MAEEKRTQRPRKHKRRSGGAKALMACAYVLLVVGVSAILATLGWNWASDLLALNKDYSSTIITLGEDVFKEQQVKNADGETVTVSRADIGAITDQLYQEGLIKYKFLFKLYSRFSKADQKIVPGQYALDTEMDYRALVTNMGTSSTTRQTVDVTIPEGYTVDQIFRLLEKEGVSTQAKLQEMAADWDYAFDWLQNIPLGDYHRLEGYLFPDTYEFYIGQDPVRVINKMLVNFDAKLTDELRTEIANSGYSIHDVVIIASMIEKETDGEDQTQVASVIYNRLKNTSGGTAGFLQIDATLQYALPERKEQLTEADKQLDSPYNTYLDKGLPAGPISNPGMVSLYAAIHPATTSYYYYVLNPTTNKHEYSRTYSEHQVKVNQYSKTSS